MIRYRGTHVFDTLEVKNALIGLGINDYGDIYYVDSVNGVAGRSGKSWDQALLTIAAAVAKCVAGDVVACKGSFTEAVVVSSAKSDLSIIGAGNTPNVFKWTAVADAVCLTIEAGSVLVANARISPPAYSANRGTCGIKLSGANYAKILKCRFQGKTASQIAIYSPVCDSDNVEISDCDFEYMNTATYGAAIKGVEAGGLSYSAWKILRNKFGSCVIGIDINGRVCLLKDNVIQEYGINAAGAVAAVLAMGIDLSGTSSGGNVVFHNQLGGTYSTTLYVPGASGDQWAGNFNVLSGGVTAANPSA